MPFRKSTFLLAFFLVIVLTCSAMAQNATVRISVEPNQAYIFVDGKAIGHGHRTLAVAPGHHTIAVRNYGYKPDVREVDLAAGRNPKLDITLEALGGPVTAAFGIIQIEGVPHTAVLLNGKQPEYFVGHGDEFNNHIWWKQQLLVPAGTHEVSLQSAEGVFWTGKLEVGANKRVILYTNDRDQPKIVVKDWPEGSAMKAVPRFTAGTASATVAIAPVTGAFGASPKQIDCGGSAKLAWNTTETLHTNITSDSGNYNGLAPVGEQTVSPRKTTTYHFLTSGPGGIIESSETVVVNSGVQASLNGTPEVHYLRVGDKVLQQDRATVNWTTGNADNVVVDQGKVNGAGENTLVVAPEKTSYGPVDETKSYTMVASNICGGSETKQGTIHLTGLVEPMISSVFFPTAYPVRNEPNKGLLPSQQAQLDRVAAIFKEYLKTAPVAKLTLTGMADVRGNVKDNYSLSERRVSIVKEYLVAKGIPADSILSVAKGEEAPLDQATVEQLEAQNPQQPPAGRAPDAKSKWLAYNRRVDITIEPAALASARFYPNQADDLEMLLNPKRVDSKIFDAVPTKAVVAANE